LAKKQRKHILKEKNIKKEHSLPERKTKRKPVPGEINSSLINRNRISMHNDFLTLHNAFPIPNYIHVLKSLDELLKRDERRKEDGFPKKIRFGKLVKPSSDGKKKIVVVPTVVEEKFIHDKRSPNQETSTGGSGEGEEGEVLGEEPIHSTERGEGQGAGEGEEALHEIESTAYDLGKLLTEEFQLPNLKDKGKKRALKKYTYDLTDKNRGFGQVLDKKATLKKIIETSLVLGNLTDIQDIDPSKLLVAPDDKVYRILSREREYESQAIVFFLRDYSGSMDGKPTELVVS